METQTVCGYFCSSGATQNHFLDSGCVEYLPHRLEITIREKKKNPRNPPQPVLVDTVTLGCGSSGIIFHFSNKPQIKRASSRKDGSKKIWNVLSKITKNSVVVTLNSRSAISRQHSCTSAAQKTRDSNFLNLQFTDDTCTNILPRQAWLFIDFRKRTKYCQKTSSSSNQDLKLFLIVNVREMSPPPMSCCYLQA